MPLDSLVGDFLELERKTAALKVKLKVLTIGQREKIEKHQATIAGLEAEIKETAAPYEEDLKKAGIDMHTIRGEIDEAMSKKDLKTVDLASAKVQVRVTKCVKILDKVALVAELSKIKDGVEKGVKAFALPHIRKLMEVGVVAEDLAEFTENRAVTITAKKPTAAELEELSETEGFTVSPGKIDAALAEEAEQKLAEEQASEDADVEGYLEAEAQEKAAAEEQAKDEAMQ